MWIDCRSLSVDDPAAPWNCSDGLPPESLPLLTAWQIAALGMGLKRRHSAPPQWLRSAPATLPDFLNYARLLSTGQARQLATLPQSAWALLRGAIKAGLFAGRHPLRGVRKDFWVVAGALLRYDLGLLPSWHQGPVLLHAQVFDMALAMDRGEFVVEALDLLGGEGRVAGIHTQQIPAALSGLRRWGCHPRILAPLWLDGDWGAESALASAAECGWLAQVDIHADLTCHPPDSNITASPSKHFPVPLRLTGRILAQASAALQTTSGRSTAGSIGPVQSPQPLGHIRI